MRYNKFIFIYLIFFNHFFLPLFSQGFQPPSEGNAAVYFVKTATHGGTSLINFFDRDHFIGAFKGMNYMRYECNASEQLFWISSQNSNFLTADLAAGSTYIIIVEAVKGAMKALVWMEPVSVNDEETIKKAKSLITERKPIVLPTETLQIKNNKFKNFIATQLNRYEEDWKTTKKYKHISPDMAIPEEKLK